MGLERQQQSLDSPRYCEGVKKIEHMRGYLWWWWVSCVGVGEADVRVWMGGGGQNTPWGALSLTTQAGVDLWGGVLTMCQNTVSTVRFFLPVRVRARPVGLLLPLQN